MTVEAEAFGAWRVIALVLGLALAAASLACLSRCSRLIGRWSAGRAFKREAALGYASASEAVGSAARCSGVLRACLLAAMLLLSLLQASVLQGALALVAGFACACAIESDVVYRYIPRELSFALLAAGFALQSAKPSSLVFGCFVGLLLVAVSVVANKTARKHEGFAFAGGGDIRMMLSLSVATGDGCLAGCFTCYAAALLWALAARRAHSVFPMAPFFALWLLAGLACSPL